MKSKKIFIIVLFLLSSIAWGKNKKLMEIKKLYLTSIKLNAVCDDKRDVIRFLDIGFVGPSFLSNLLSNFHRNNPHVDLTQGIFAGELKHYRKKVYYDPAWVYFDNNFNLEQLTSQDREIIRQKAGTDYELTLNLRTSLWEQKISGSYTIYHQGVKIYSGKLQATSTYIIKDKNSPYITEYDSKIDHFQNPLDHRGEISKIYGDLGEEIGDTLRSLFVAQVKPKKKKKTNAPKRKKKQRTTQQLDFWDLMKPQY